MGSPYGAVKRFVIASHGPSVATRWRVSRPSPLPPSVNEPAVTPGTQDQL